MKGDIIFRSYFNCICIVDFKKFLESEIWELSSIKWLVWCYVFYFFWLIGGLDDLDLCEDSWFFGMYDVENKKYWREWECYCNCCWNLNVECGLVNYIKVDLKFFILIIVFRICESCFLEIYWVGNKKVGMEFRYI